MRRFVWAMELVAALVCLVAPPGAGAQGSEPAPQYFAPGASWLGRFHLSPYGDLRLRFDRVIDRPGATTDLERVRGRLRTGLVWSPHPMLGIEAGGYWGMWKAADSDLAATFDNEHDDSLAVDRLAMVVSSPSITLALGKRPLPLTTTDLTWDADLRPVGATLVTRRDLGAFDEMRFAAAGVARSEDGHGVMFAAQLAYALRPGAAQGAELLAGVAAFSAMDDLAKEGLGRQNRFGLSIVPTPHVGFAEDFTLVELQATGRMKLGPVPWSVALHAVRNTSTDLEGRGFRGSTRFGELEGRAPVELGYVFQVIEREAVPGAFNSDDWWFHSRASGHRAWVAVRPSPWATARISAFDERRDDVTKRTRRLLLDIELELSRQ